MTDDQLRQRYLTALLRIAMYKKKTDEEDDYQSILSIQMIAEEAIEPAELVY